jgi:hypothetical protein
LDLQQQYWFWLRPDGRRAASQLTAKEKLSGRRRRRKRSTTRSARSSSKNLGGNRAVRPQFKVVLGGAKNSVNYDQRELTLTKWDPYLFAQGVVMLSVEDLMSPKQRAELARRAVSWADATIDVHHLTK